MRPAFKGARIVGGYWIPYREAAAYKRRVKRLKKAALKAMGRLCPYAVAQFANSQDGEAVTGLDTKGGLLALIHLDSEGLDLIEQGLAAGNLEEALRVYVGEGDVDADEG